ncbi:hypothetical protein C2S53_015474 [Perilla frutescens var. hirtella]|uniref:Protein kinase domain-containing protein n=1 Tax=Perilla frutescens var. hirtella TaxID=608512 RepID=A0AAD4IUC8_PERFH|nr:hypothetical protein C2S53_015474 [Perilla frutescens var. hirtella]
MAVDLGNGDGNSKYLKDFTELEFIACGGFSSVVKCRSRLDGKLYAVKKISVEFSGMTVDRVLREAQIMAELDHPHIAKYHEAWVEDQMWGDTGHFYKKCDVETKCVFILMDLYNCSPLDQLLENDDKLEASISDGSIFRLFKECVAAVSYIHSRGYVHCDMTASNVLVVRGADSTVTAKVIDFGLARRMDDEGLVVISNQLGHIMYRAPECIAESTRTTDRPVVKVGAKADMFSLGVILAQILHPTCPIEMFEDLREIPIPDRWREGTYGSILARLVSLSPDERPSAAQLLQELDSLPPSADS